MDFQDNDEARIGEGPAEAAETLDFAKTPLVQAPSPNLNPWLQIALRVKEAKALPIEAGRWELIRAIASENGITSDQSVAMHMALKGYAIGLEHGIGDRLARATHHVSQAISRWPKDRIQEGIALVIRCLDGEVSKSELKRRVDLARSAAGIRTRAPNNLHQEDPADTPEASPEKEPGQGATVTLPEPEHPFPGPTEWHGAALGAEALRAASEAPEPPMGHEAELLEALAGKRRIEALDALAGLILSESDHRISLATLAWPDERLCEALAMARAAIDGIITVDEVIRAGDVQRRIAAADEILGQRSRQAEEEAVADANWRLADEWHGKDYYAWCALTRTAKTYGPSRVLEIVPHPEEPDEFIIRDSNITTRIILIRPGLSAAQYAAARKRALERAALETFNRGSNAVVAMPPEAEPAILLEAARAKGIETLWTLTLTRYYGYNEKWEKAIREIEEAT